MFKFNPINHYKVSVVSVDEEFSRIPGHYVYAQGEGSFNIIRNNKLAVARILKGNSSAVEMRDVFRNKSSNVRLDFGWYAYSGANSLAKDFKI